VTKPLESADDAGGADSADAGRGSGPELAVRHAARVLLVDEADRVLLFRTHLWPGREHAFWYPVGGEVEAGESHEQAVVREAFEETGLAGLQLGPEIAQRRFIFHWREHVWDARERWWLARVAHFEPVFAGMEEIEIDDFSACRWLSLAELSEAEAAGDVLTPRNLLSFLPGLLAGEIPSAPLVVGE
jgi:ADP-ribose pyrophosphatase YjhB (NUDIX family)